uniref:Chromatin assembly factor 1 subunit A n=1 Tax=Plectus sambesii TaxID=2011161 RepID=A0A914V1J3_9BILA
MKREEEAKQLKAHKQAITSFFKKVDPKPTQLCTVGPESSRFRPFQLKEGMRMASILRRTPLTDSERQSLDEHMINQTCEERLECVKKLRTKRLVGSRQSETTVVSKDDGDVRALNSPDTVGPRMKAKLIQFHDNCRPPYYGTWRKKSVFITGRRPYGQDKQLDYDVDSDEEWEDEPEDAEDCNSDDEDEAPQDGKEDPDEDDDDGFFVEHGYLSDGEGVSDEDDQCQDAETRRARMAAKAEAWKTDVRMEKERKSKKLLPFIIGPCWNYALLDHQLAAKLRPFKALRIGDGPLLTSYNRPQPPAVA